MTDESSHHDAGASLGNNLSLLAFGVEPRVDLIHPQPLVMHDDVQGKKFDDHRKIVDSQVVVCDSILETIINKTYIYEKLDRIGLDRPLALNFYQFGIYAYESYKDYRDFLCLVLPQIESRIPKRRKMIDVFHEDGTFSHETEKYEFFYRDLLIAPPENNVFSLDVFDLPPDDWLYPSYKTDHVVFRSARKKRFQFFRVDVETGETKDVSRGYVSPYEPFQMSSLRWVDFEKRSENLDDCSGELNFVRVLSAEGKIRLRLKTAQFCRQRLCPMCMWRRSMVWYSRFLARFTDIKHAFSNYRLLHLVLTVPNVHISNLRSTLQRMNKAWHRMINLGVKNPLFPESKVIKGFLRSVEVTREYQWSYIMKYDNEGKQSIKSKYVVGMGREGYVHPHFHILLAVPSTYMARGFIPAARWLEVWRDAMQDQSITNVKIQLVQGGKKFKDMEEGSVEDLKNAMLKRDTLFSSLPELVKYSTKPTEFSQPFEKGWETAEQRDFFYYKYEREVKFLRFISTGGIFKDILGKDKDVDDVSNEELVSAGSYLREGDQELPDTLDFNWDKESKHYFLTWVNYEEDYEE